MKKTIDDPALDLEKIESGTLGSCVICNGDDDKKYYKSARPWDPLSGCYKVSVNAYLISKRKDCSVPGIGRYVLITVYEVLVVETKKAIYRFSLGVNSYNIDTQYLSQPHYWLTSSQKNLYNILNGYVQKGMLPEWVLNPNYKLKGD